MRVEKAQAHAPKSPVRRAFLGGRSQVREGAYTGAKKPKPGRSLPRTHLPTYTSKLSRSRDMDASKSASLKA